MFHQGLPWLSSGSDSVLPLQGVQVQTLVQELRFRVTFSVAKKKKKELRFHMTCSVAIKKKKKKVLWQKDPKEWVSGHQGRQSETFYGARQGILATRNYSKWLQTYWLGGCAHEMVV